MSSTSNSHFIIGRRAVRLAFSLAVILGFLCFRWSFSSPPLFLGFSSPPPGLRPPVQLTETKACLYCDCPRDSVFLHESRPRVFHTTYVLHEIGYLVVNMSNVAHEIAPRDRRSRGQHIQCRGDISRRPYLVADTGGLAAEPRLTDAKDHPRQLQPGRYCSSCDLQIVTLQRYPNSRTPWTTSRLSCLTRVGVCPPVCVCVCLSVCLSVCVCMNAWNV